MGALAFVAVSTYAFFKFHNMLQQEEYQFLTREKIPELEQRLTELRGEEQELDKLLKARK